MLNLSYLAPGQKKTLSMSYSIAIKILNAHKQKYCTNKILHERNRFNPLTMDCTAQPYPYGCKMPWFVQCCPQTNFISSGPGTT